MNKRIIHHRNALKDVKKHFKPELRVYAIKILADHTSHDLVKSYHVSYQNHYLTKTQALNLAKKISNSTRTKIIFMSPKEKK